MEPLTNASVSTGEPSLSNGDLSSPFTFSMHTTINGPNLHNPMNNNLANDFESHFMRVLNKVCATIERNEVLKF